MPKEPSPALKDLLGPEPHRRFSAAVRAVYPAFNEKRFLELTLRDIDSRSLTQRLRRATEALRETLPGDYLTALKILRGVAPKLGRSFGQMVFPDFVGQYGREHYRESLDALRFFTCFGSSEFAVREYLRDDLPRTLAEMVRWAEDADEHVRRLSSEGSRPRLPWSFRLTPLMRDPSLTVPILAKLMDDPSLYVRKSVANHLNDISKDHADWLIDWLRRQDLKRPRTLWIAKRALRTLVKKGHPGALSLVGATGEVAIDQVKFTIAPKTIRLGEAARLALSLRSAGKKPQHLVIDYAIHYVKSSGGTSRKVFKWKAVDLDPGEALALEKSQRIEDFTTRKHYAGKHAVEVLVNGAVVANGSFGLKV